MRSVAAMAHFFLGLTLLIWVSEASSWSGEDGIPSPRSRKGLSVIHLVLFFGLITYAFANLVDVLEGFIPGFELVYGGKYLAFPFPYPGLINAFNLTADLMSGALLVAMTAFLVRRFITKDQRLS